VEPGVPAVAADEPSVEPAVADEPSPEPNDSASSL
jgi:hypothetical protein